MAKAPEQRYANKREDRVGIPKSTGLTQSEIDALAAKNLAEADAKSAKIAKDLADAKAVTDAKDLQTKYDALLAKINADAAAAELNTANNAQFLDLQAKYEELLNGQAQDRASLALNLAAEKKQKRDSIVDIMKNRFKQYGLESLSDTILQLAQDGASEDTITFALQESDVYKERFKANAARIKANLSVLSPAEYLNLEDSYRQVLRASGLNQFDNDNYVSQFIANDMSPNELASRVSLATMRVQNEDPSVLKQLGDYYGITATDLISTALDPKQQLNVLQNKVTAAEIGAAGVKQGFGVSALTAEQLALQGVTQEQAQRGYSTIGDVLPTASKLSGIYGKTLDSYDQATAEQEVFGGLASAKRKREQLIGREQATFGGSSGTLGASYGTPRSAFNKSSAGQI